MLWADTVESDLSLNAIRADPILAQPLKSNVAVECWLNDRLGRDPNTHVCDEIDALLPGTGTGPAPYAWQRRALHHLGIARTQLAESGLDSAHIDRLYRALFVYGSGVSELFAALNPPVAGRVWKAYWTIVDGVGDRKSSTVFREVTGDLTLRLVEFKDRLVRMTLDATEQRQWWQKDIRALAATAKEKEETVARLENIVGRHQQDADALSQALALHRLQNDELAHQLIVCKARLAQSSVDLDQLRRDKADADATIGLVTLKKKSLEDQVEADEKRFVAMEAAQRAIAQEKTRVEVRAQQLLTALHSSQTDHRHDHVRLNDMNHHCQLQERIVAQLHTDLAECRRRLTGETALRDTLRQEYAEAATAIRALTADNADLRAKVTAAADQARTRSTDFDRARLQLLALREKFEAQGAELTGVVQARDQLRADLDRQTAEMGAASTLLFCMRQQLSNRRRAWNDACRKFADLRVQLLDCRTQIGQLNRGDQQQQQRIESLTTAANDSKEQMKAIGLQHQREIAQLRHDHRSVCVQRDEYVEMTALLKATLEQAQRDVCNLEVAATAKTSQIAQYHQRIQEDSVHLRTLRTDLDVLAAKQAAVESRLDITKAELAHAIDANTLLTKTCDDAKLLLGECRHQCDQARAENELLRCDRKEELQRVVHDAEHDRRASQQERERLIESHQQTVRDLDQRLIRADVAEKELEQLLLARVEQSKALSRDLSDQIRINRDTARQYAERLLVLQQDRDRIARALQAMRTEEENSANNAHSRSRARDAFLEFIERDRTPPVQTASIGIQTIIIFDVVDAATAAGPAQAPSDAQTDPPGPVFPDSSRSQDALSSRRTSQSLASVQVRSSPASTLAPADAPADAASFAAAVAPVALAQLKMKTSRLARKHHAGSLRLPPVMAGRAGSSVSAISANTVRMGQDDHLAMTGLGFSSGRHP